MTYCTLSDLTTRFGEEEITQLTDRGMTGAVDTSVSDKAIADADAEIDGYLAGRYTLPLAYIPSNLTRIACDIARYLLYENAATQIVIDRHEAASRYLEMVGKGTIDLPPDVNGDPLPVSGSMAAVESDAQIVTSADWW